MQPRCSFTCRALIQAVSFHEVKNLCVCACCFNVWYFNKPLAQYEGGGLVVMPTPCRPLTFMCFTKPYKFRAARQHPGLKWNEGLLKLELFYLRWNYSYW